MVEFRSKLLLILIQIRENNEPMMDLMLVN